jgi:hypothetical protein
MAHRRRTKSRKTHKKRGRGRKSRKMVGGLGIIDDFLRKVSGIKK